MFKTVPIPFDMIYSQHGSLKPQYMYLRRLYEPANADSSLIQKTFINTQLPPVTSLFFCCTVRRIHGAIHYMYTIPLSTCKFILILLFSLVLQMKNQLNHRTSLSLQIQLILPWLFFFFCTSNDQSIISQSLKAGLRCLMNKFQYPPFQ